MKKTIIFMFSGQGSQYYHMGKKLFNSNLVFKKWMVQLDEIAHQFIGQSVIEHIYDDSKKKDEQFDRLLYTIPAIFMVEYSLMQVLLEYGIVPDYVLGASLGEVAAAATAGVMDHEKLFISLIEQAKIFEAYCPRAGMLAVLSDLNLYYSTPLIRENSELAAQNYSSHFVISGEIDRLARIKEFLKEKNVVFQQLPVTYGFHSSLIDPVEQHFLNICYGSNYNKPKIPFVSCVYGDFATELSTEYLWNVVRKPIRFSKAVQFLENNQNYIYLDLGPGGTLANFVKRNLQGSSQSKTYSIMTQFDLDLKNLEEVKSFLKQSCINSRKEGCQMKAYVFPGQGSQFKGMGGTLFDEFVDLTSKTDKILGYSIKELCLEDPQKRLNQTRYTQPALYVVNALSYLKIIKDSGLKPDYVAGHSLGEYNALFSAGAFDFETGLKLVIKRGELMSHESDGGMAAVVGLSEERITDILNEYDISSVQIANYNAPSQIVISGPQKEINRINTLFEKAGAIYIPLNVSGAFHSEHMSRAKSLFESFLESFDFYEIKIPVISNVHARPYKQDELKKNLADQITHPVKWTEIIRYLMGLGVKEFKELGPGNVLSKLMGRIKKETEPLVISNESTEITTQNSDIAFTAGENELVQENSVQAEKNTAAISAYSLGDEDFKREYNLKYAYLTGSMYRGVASEELVVRIGKAGLMGFFGTGGLSMSQIEEAIQNIKKGLDSGQSFGMNLIHNPSHPQIEENTIDLFIKHNVRNIEASAFMGITPSLVRYRLQGLSQDANGSTIITNRIMAKVSRPEVAEAFLSPAPERIVEKMVKDNEISRVEADMLKKVSLADDICVEADSGGHTDNGVAYVLMPAMLQLRDEMMKKYNYLKKIRVGAAGGIGTPEAAAAAFILGADFILTGSINQCTVEAGTSDAVKDMLQQINVQDTEYAPSGDMFEMGAKVQVLKRGVFFPARANKLHDLYRQYNSLDEIDEKTKKLLQERYFKRTFGAVFEEVKSHYPVQEIEKAERSPKYKMALVFKWYFAHSSRLALSGTPGLEVDYQIPCGPALGAFNQWVKGTAMENWRNRHVDEIAEKLMIETAGLLNRRFNCLNDAARTN